jgi:hypothetical protein
MKLFPTLVKLWIVLAALLCAGGWLLSLARLLTPLGYGLLFLLAGVGLVLVWRRAGPRWQPRAAWARLRCRFRRPLPLMFLALAVLALVGGSLYAPANYDTLSYREPRILQWLAEGQWHWIHTPNYRMNNRACNFEWLMTPLLAFTHSDRGVFLLNLTSFLLLPGLVFSVFCRFGVRPRVAWHWMWLLPTGWNFALQAGSTGNDAYAAVYALAAVDLALRARVSGRASDWWLSLVAAALLTGSKATNLPLALPWLVAALPSWRLALARPLLGAVAVLTAALVSFLPMAALNYRHCGDWTGIALESHNIAMKNPLVGFWGNGLLFAMQNLVPPFFPAADWWNRCGPELLPRPLYEAMLANFEQGFLRLNELAVEDGPMSGVGFGVSWLLLVSLVAAWRLRRQERNGGASPGQPWTRARCFQVCLWAAPFVALAALTGRSGLACVSRIISPYYPLLFAVLLLPAGHALVVRRRWWQRAALMAGALTAMVVLVTPPRPLWPAQTVLQKLNDWLPGRRILERAQTVYEVYDRRADALAPMRELVPDHVRVIGYVASHDDPEASLWRPFGRRRVEHILRGDTPERTRQRGIEYVVLSGIGLTEFHRTTLTEWLGRHQAELLAHRQLRIRAASLPQDWYVARLQPVAAASP